ncbi:uncharacterized protein LOC132747700 [Ruditapes philippinarum]|uniref:uncharacterized protein LOC132747700 n=1 Tax=Ruditapes philippinarum TaxID=129788 RepID=UPI00295A935E|nr:uncharacterized protein LOC132747700 [Ruditapes philippinarum]
MCATCFRHHLKSKRTRHHILLSLEEFSPLTLDCGSEDVIKCKKHDDEIIKFYCRLHDVVGCGDCIVLEHTSCKPEYIKDLAKTFRDGDVYKSIVKRAEDLRKKKSDYEQEIEISKEGIEKMNENALVEIRKFRKEINECLDGAEANLMSEMKEMRKENTAKQEKITTGLQSLTSELQTMTHMLNAQLHHGNALFINAVNCRSKLADMETMYKNTTKERTLKGFGFVRNETMAELLKAAEPLGRLIKSFTKREFVVGSRVRRGPHWALLWKSEFSNLSLGSVSGDVTRYEKHKNEIIKFYCRSHVAVGCGDGIILEHTTCKPEYINDLSKTFKEGNIYKTAAKRVEDIEKKITTYEHRLGKSGDEVEKMYEKNY